MSETRVQKNRLGLGLLKEGFGVNKNRTGKEAAGWGWAEFWVRTDSEAGAAWVLRTRWRCVLVPRPLSAGHTVVNTQAGGLPSC